MYRFVVFCLGIALSSELAFAGMTAGASKGMPSGASPKDIVLVLDNSGSMRKNDPGFLIKRVVSQFIDRTEPDTRLAILIFDKYLIPAVSLTEISDQTSAPVRAGLTHINYRGLFTNTAAAMNRAIQELIDNGRADATKSIILLTDGIIDTGDKARDQESTLWLREELAGEAVRTEIKVFGIGLTSRSDSELLRTLAERSGGEYYQAARIEEVGGAFERIQETINAQATIQVEAVAPLSSPAEDVALTTQTNVDRKEAIPGPADRINVASPKPKATTPSSSSRTAEASKLPRPRQASQPQSADSSPSMWERLRFPNVQNLASDRIARWFIGVSLLLILLILLLVGVLAKNKEPRAPTRGSMRRGRSPQAFLYDLSGVTGVEYHEIAHPLTLIGRIPPNSAEKIGHLVIDHPTIGRRHALIERKHHSYWLIDQSSKNGTFVNDERVYEEVCLGHGDRVRFHDIEFEFALAGMGLADATVAVSNLRVLSGQTVSSGSDRPSWPKVVNSGEGPDQSNPATAAKSNEPTDKPLDFPDVTAPNAKDAIASVAKYFNE